MPRSVWEGHLRLSLVMCPVALYKATSSKGGVAFNLINPKTKSRIVQVVKDPTTGEELARKTLVKGFAVAKNQYVLVDPKELKALRIESTYVLDLERFVDAATIDRIYWDEPYYLAPSEKTGVEAFTVILEAMREETDRHWQPGLEYARTNLHPGAVRQSPPAYHAAHARTRIS